MRPVKVAHRTAPELPPFNNTIKIVSIGESGIGKSQLLRMLAGNGLFDERNISTIGVDMLNMELESSYEKPLKVQLWDTAGQERYQAITRSYFRASHAVLLCFQIGDADSYNKMDAWHKELKLMCPAARICIVGTKADIHPPLTPPTPIADPRYRDYPYYETSAKSGLGLPLLKQFFFAVGDTQRRIAAEKALARGEK